MAPRLLIAGIGNIFLGDDAFGVEVVQRLLRRAWPDGVRVVDFGIRGLDLTYALLDGFEAVILIDATPRGGAPGTLYVLEPNLASNTDRSEALETHALDPARVLRLARMMGAPPRRMLVVGCEPSPVEDVEEMAAGLSAPVRAAVDAAVPMVAGLVAELLQDQEAVAHS